MAETMAVQASNGEFARIEKDVFVPTMLGMLGVGIVAAIARTFLRVYRFRTFAADDYFLWLAVVLMTASTTVVYSSIDYTYTQLNVSLLKVPPPPSFTSMMAKFETQDTIATATVWGAIFAVKFSFVMFFKKLITNVGHLHVLWWVVLGCLIASAPTNMFLGFYICSDFSNNMMSTCTSDGMVKREKIYLIITVVIDIFTDLLVISIPSVLLARAKLPLKKKLKLAAVLSLSLFMILVAITRVAFAMVSSPELREGPPGTLRSVPDTVWLFFWQQMEACVAILMVSLTAFRSMVGQQHHISRQNTEAGHGTKSIGGVEKSSFGRPDRATFLDKFRRTSVMELDKHEPKRTASNGSSGSEIDRSKISYPVTPLQRVAMTGFDQGPPPPPPPPPKSPRWQRPSRSLGSQSSTGSNEIEHGPHHVSRSFV